MVHKLVRSKFFPFVFWGAVIAAILAVTFGPGAPAAATPTPVAPTAQQDAFGMPTCFTDALYGDSGSWLSVFRTDGVEGAVLQMTVYPGGVSWVPPAEIEPAVTWADVFGNERDFGNGLGIELLLYDIRPDPTPTPPPPEIAHLYEALAYMEVELTCAGYDPLNPIKSVRLFPGDVMMLRIQRTHPINEKDVLMEEISVWSVTEFSPDQWYHVTNWQRFKPPWAGNLHFACGPSLYWIEGMYGDEEWPESVAVANADDLLYGGQVTRVEDGLGFVCGPDNRMYTYKDDRESGPVYLYKDDPDTPWIWHQAIVPITWDN